MVQCVLLKSEARDVATASFAEQCWLKQDVSMPVVESIMQYTLFRSSQKVVTAATICLDCDVLQTLPGCDAAAAQFDLSEISVL